MTIIVTLLAMKLGHRLQWFEMATQSWIELVLTLPIVLGRVGVLRSWRQSIVHRSPNMDTDRSGVRLPAFIYSGLQRSLLACSRHRSMGRVAVYFEAKRR